MHPGTKHIPWGECIKAIINIKHGLHTLGVGGNKLQKQQKEECIKKNFRKKGIKSYHCCYINGNNIMY